MTTLVDTVKKLGRPPVPRGDGNSAAPIRARLAEVEAQLTILRQDYPQAALAFAQEAEGSAERLTDLEARIAGQEKQIAVLQAALVEAEAADERLIQQQRTALYRSQFISVKKALAQRQDVASKLMVHLENAAAAFHELVELSETAVVKGRMIAAEGRPFAQGSLLASKELYDAVAREIRRISTPWPVTVENSRVPTLPFDKDACSRFENIGTIAPLTDEIRSRDERLLEVLEGREPARLR